MYVLGHIGLTVAAVRRLERDVDTRWAALLALAPDILDKPLSRLVPELAHHNTRGLGHSIAFSLCVLGALLLWKRKPRPALVLWGCYVGHFVLDAMWSGHNPRILLWPLLGDFPPHVYGSFFGWMTLWNVTGEIAGLAVLVSLARTYGPLDRSKFSTFLKTGALS